MPGAFTPAAAPDGSYPPAGGPRCAWHSANDATLRCADCEIGLCRLCAAAAPDPDGGPPRPVCPTCAPLCGVASSVPWERRESGRWAAYFGTARLALGRPAELFAAFPHAPLGPAVGFLYLTYLPLAGLAALVAVAFAVTAAGDGLPMREPGDRLVVAIGVAIPVFFYLMLPLFAAGSGMLLHAVARMLGSRAPFVATWRMVCYLAPLELVSTVCAFVVALAPFGGLLAFPLQAVWIAWASYAGVRRLHGLPKRRALAVVLTPILIWVGCLGALVAVAFFAAAMRF